MYRSTVLTITLMLLFTTAGVASDAIVNVAVRKGEVLMDSAIGDDASGVIAVANVDARNSRIIRFAKNRVLGSIALDGFQIRGIEKLERAPRHQYLVRGVTGAAYPHGTFSYRLIDLSSDKPVTVWDSSALRLDADFSLNRSGTLWAAVRKTASASCRLTVGTVSPNQVLAQIDIRTSGDAAKKMRSFSDSVRAHFLDHEQKHPVVAILLNGVIHVIRVEDGDSHQTSFIAGDEPATDILYESASRMLWARGKRSLYGFGSDDLLSALKSKERRVKPARKWAKSVDAGDLVDVSPQNDGTFFVISRQAGTGIRAAELVDDAGRSVARRMINDRAPVRVSPSGRLVLEMPPQRPAENAGTITLNIKSLKQ